MPVLSIGLVVGAVIGAFVAGGSLDAGFPVEVAIVRGVIGFMAVAVVGYLGELVVVTAPRRPRAVEPASRDAGAREAAERTAAPRLIAAARALNDSPDEQSNAEEADVDLRPAA